MAARDYVFLCLSCGETFTTRALTRVSCPHCRGKAAFKALVDEKELDGWAGWAEKPAVRPQDAVSASVAHQAD